MKIAKVINNNVISVLDEQKKELVVMGRGIAFQKKPGDAVDEARIEKVFTLENKGISDKLQKLLNDIPMEYMTVSEEIINHAKVKLGRKLNDNIYISLTDHIHFAIERQQKGVNITNALLWEIKRIYKDEYAVGKEALQMIQQKLGINLPEDEAGFLAMHIVNAELNEEIPNVVNITKLVQDVLNIVKYHFRVELDEESLNYFRFLTHLKFFAQRLLNGTSMDRADDFLYDLIKDKHKEVFECTQKIKAFVESEYKRELTKEEMAYLALHIERVVNRK
ncbi:BglG family transcription antiterminator LicT [Bacillus sp. V5-8f]|uniref:BglG family transcription antiterminator LicT n=1 Tax=Bacillus sp. V5-8f TaxID=2053044 RepID=UPI000C78EE84|nr:PRD domain-containing protein [Bacillus sp. V5-8f]PLT33337.1 transcription antiterminator LicT [Bacillus sp. V5-8f]